MTQSSHPHRISGSFCLFFDSLNFYDVFCLPKLLFLLAQNKFTKAFFEIGRCSCWPNKCSKQSKAVGLKFKKGFREGLWLKQSKIQ